VHKKSRASARAHTPNPSTGHAKSKRCEVSLAPNLCRCPVFRQNDESIDGAKITGDTTSAHAYRLCRSNPVVARAQRLLAAR
jgi:hypothetical protein